MTYQTVRDRVDRVKSKVPRENPSKQFTYLTIEEAEQMLAVVESVRGLSNMWEVAGWGEVKDAMTALEAW